MKELHKMKVGEKVRINKDIPSINGMLHKDTTVRIDEISIATNKNNIRVIDNLGKIWFVGEEDING